MGSASWDEACAAIEKQLSGLLPRERSGFVVAVEVATPRPWPPALEMRRLRSEGASVEEIAKQLGYAVVTVERNLRTGGRDPRTGDHCTQRLGRRFSVSEALAAKLLPCSPACVCHWRPIFRSDPA